MPPGCWTSARGRASWPAGRSARGGRWSAWTRPRRRCGRHRTGGRPRYARSGAEQLPFADGAFDAVVTCLVFEHLLDPEPPIREVARVLEPGGRFLFFLNHPLLQAPDSGWVDDQIMEPPEQYWRVGAYLVEDVRDEEVAPGVVLPFVHRPLSRYLNLMVRRGPGPQAHGGAGAAAGVPGPGRGVPAGRDHPPAAVPASPSVAETARPRAHRPAAG